MKNLSEFINEQLILELSSDTYLAAANKAKEMGDNRFEKFLAAYAKEVKKESNGDKEKLNEYYKSDKPIFTRLNKLGQKETRLDWNIDGYIVTPMLSYINGNVKYPFLPRVFPEGIKFPWNTNSNSKTKYFITTISKGDNLGFLIYEYPNDRVVFDMSPVSKLKEPDDEFKEVITKVLNAVAVSSRSYDEWRINQITEKNKKE